MSKAIEFVNVGKQYRLGLVGTGSLQHDINRWWQTSILGKEDPYLKIGEVNDRSTKGHSDYVWALKDINFSVEEGDVVGIIGKNGAGKSTLLKLLSHITAPSTGHITYRGRIASLLEVGTGFHPEMTARENIYMNGSIMGMTKQEITRKLDEIVDFAGIERYLDTPVKRFSSGMTVRLGFAVAAFLEPEILVVDEVLAVGDAEFQKKAIGKMKDVSSQGGRTVMFVSHNMEAIGRLCKSCVLLENGQIKGIGDTSLIISRYLLDNYEANYDNVAEINLNDRFYVRNFKIIQNGCEVDVLTQGDSYSVIFDVLNNTDTEADMITSFEIQTESANSVTCMGNEFQNEKIQIPAGHKRRVEFIIRENLLKKATYYMNLFFMFKYNHGTDVEMKNLEFTKKFAVEEPTSLFVSNPHKVWQKFPICPEHGYIATRIESINVKPID